MFRVGLKKNRVGSPTGTTHTFHLRPKEKYVLFPVTCPKFLGSVGRQTFFYKNFFVWKKYKNT